MAFQQKLDLGIEVFSLSMTDLAMVWPAGSDFWKASLKKCSSYKANKADRANSKCPFKQVVRLYGGAC